MKWKIDDNKEEKSRQEQVKKQANWHIEVSNILWIVESCSAFILILFLFVQSLQAMFEERLRVLLQEEAALQQQQRRKTLASHSNRDEL